MANLTCDICEGKLIVGAGGVAVCENCGMEHSKERLKEKLSENSVQTKPTPAAPQNDELLLENYLSMAESSCESTNKSEAENYANKALELSPHCVKAWFIKGKAAGWQSISGQVRLNECVLCFKKAIEFSSDDERDDYIDKTEDELTVILKAFINSRAEMFASYPTNDNATALIGSGQTTINTLSSVNEKMPITFDLHDFNDFIADRMNTSSITASDNADRKFGPSEAAKTQYAYNIWMANTDNCIKVLEYASAIATSSDVIENIYSNLKTLQLSVINSCSYKFVYNDYASGGYYTEDTCLTPFAKNARRNAISRYEIEKKNKLNQIKAKQESEHQMQIDKYWQEHADEKKQLEDYKQQLFAKKEELEKKKSVYSAEIASLYKNRAQTVPAEIERHQIQSRIYELNTAKNALGIFKTKERKEIQDEIDKLDKELAVIAQRIPEQIQKQKEQSNARINELNNFIIPIDKEIQLTIDEIAKVNTKLNLQ